MLKKLFLTLGTLIILGIGLSACSNSNPSAARNAAEAANAAMAIHSI